MSWQMGMNRALEFIEKNLNGTIELSSIARCANSSVWEFQRLFALLTNIPVGEYIRRRRLALAAQALQSGNYKVVDIALEYGYDSPAAFSRAFKKEFGITPSAARSEQGLPICPKITSEYIMKEWLKRMSKFSERGYVVRENGPVYFTMDMEKTLEWFQNILGWYGDIASRREDGKAEYGCVFDYPEEVAISQITPFRGFHLFAGEPIKGVAGFMVVDGLDALHSYVKEQGWEQISEISDQPWGARECQVTTIDGCILRFFETNGTK